MNINVDDLCPELPRSTGKLNVDTISINYPLIEINDSMPHVKIDHNEIIKKINMKRKNKLYHYLLIFNKCCRKINEASDKDLYDIVFSVPYFVSQCPLYCVQECVDFVNQRLKKELFDTYVLNDTSLFITWRFIELKKERTSRPHE